MSSGRIVTIRSCSGGDWLVYWERPVAGDILAYMTLPEGCLEAALHAVFGDGRGALPGGEKPYLWPVL